MRKQAGLLFLLKLLKVPLNILLLSLTAKYFGVSLEKDVWLLAFTTISVIDLAVWGPVNETFRTKFIAVKETESQEVAIKHTQSLITYFIIFSLFSVGVIILFPNKFSLIIAPDYTVYQRLILVKMLYYVAPMLLFNQLMQIGLSILNAFEIFNVAEISGFFSTIANILLLVFLADYLNIYALVFAQYCSTFLLIGFIIYYLKKKKIKLLTLQDWNTDFGGFKIFFLFAIPFFLPYFFGQINGVVEKVLAGKIGEGTISILDFANRIPTLLYGIIISIITTILVPVLSTAFLRKEEMKFNEEFRKMFQLGTIIIGLIIAFICGASTPLTLFLYDKGAIAKQNLADISALSIFYAMALYGIFVYVIFGMALLSSQNQKKYAAMGVFAQIVVVILNFMFYKIAGIYTFPVSVLISHLFFGLLMYRYYPFKESLQLNWLKYALVVILLAVILYLGTFFVFFDNNVLNIISAGILLIGAGFLLSVVFDLEERRIILHFFTNKLRKTR